MALSYLTLIGGLSDKNLKKNFVLAYNCQCSKIQMTTQHKIPLSPIDFWKGAVENWKLTRLMCDVAALKV